VIQFLLEEFSKCFTDEKSAYKQKELLALAELIIDKDKEDKENKDPEE
jgi:hypothetical protein